MPIDREQVLHIARLARVGLSEEDVARFQEQLSQILDYFQVLEELDTSEVPPTSHVLPLENVMREDEPSAPMPAEEALANAPQREGDFFKVRAVLEE
ncbi:MAG: Asp-tRNA(Asn)/Glu-tRNA(Gln) amidotransferase subunit GatC [Dehalococcoidia bacterium]|jgi:aspartyl-tRNA(Asn)/glutamyl-tRNA(Gln) amidotransferase subunit C|nr:Asp-tRNA(Asn)/Glu-tRNA(Gln) amidotransferase subunit GatC [Dehalococcoidia bacterium]MDW8009419.1 Asp-tRNA(Asn)/Glu-tRNA(Gln) amidotransferase subunit GatC [Chloroflexota bacterium]